MTTGTIVCHELAMQVLASDPGVPRIHWMYNVEGPAGLIGVRDAGILRRGVLYDTRTGASLVVYCAEPAIGHLAALSAVLFGAVQMPDAEGFAREMLHTVEEERRKNLAEFGSLQ